jgi:predicted permease
MPGYWQLLLFIAPVFGLIAVGALIRRVCRLTEETETGLLRVYVTFLYPCLILRSVLGNAALYLGLGWVGG